MNPIIPVSERQIGDGMVQAVSARDLHAFLDVGKDFSTWIKDRISQYGFVEQHDFVTYSAAPQNGGAGNRGQRVEYAISLDMAKELAMVERNERGKQARLYFIDCERRAKRAGQIDLSDPIQLRNALLSYSDKVIALESKVQEQAPKAAFHDDVAEAINGQTVQEVAKVLGTGPNRLFQWLRESGVLMDNNLPYQKHVDMGHIRVVERRFRDRHGEVHTYTKSLITGKGLIYIQKRIQSAKGFMQPETAV